MLLALALAHAAPPADPCPTGCISFIVNIHDVNHVPESADTLLRLVDIFERNGVRGDFYFTGPIVELYEAERPDVIARLRASSMTVSYHVRPPHPLVTGFDGALVGRPDTEVEATLRDYETRALDRATGALDHDRLGGYALVREAFGRPPTTVAAPNSDRRIRLAALRVYRSLGARAVVWYHQEQAAMDRPFDVREGLLVRPSDIGVTKWSAVPGSKEQFWWEKLDKGVRFDPATHLQEALSTWQGTRGPFVTSAIHENNFYRAGPEGWTLSYYTDAEKTTPLPPPWNLHPREESRVRSPADAEAVWSAYEAMVRWSAAHMRVVTSDDLVTMAGQAGAFTTPPASEAPR